MKLLTQNHNRHEFNLIKMNIKRLWNKLDKSLFSVKNLQRRNIYHSKKWTWLIVRNITSGLPRPFRSWLRDRLKIMANVLPIIGRYTSSKSNVQSADFVKHRQDIVKLFSLNGQTIVQYFCRSSNIFADRQINEGQMLHRPLSSTIVQ